MITPDCCRKSGQTHQKGISSSGIQGVQSKERFLQRITVKKFCLPYAILCCTMNLHCIIYALHCVRIVYYAVIFPDCTLSTTLFSSFWFLFTLFLGFSSALLFSISIYCGFSPLYYYDALVVSFCRRLCFLPLLWCRNLFLVHSTSFSRGNFISLYRVLLLRKNLTLLICSNLLVLLY